MLHHTFLTVLLLLFSTSAWGATFVVTLGENGTLTFQPDVVIASPGDIVAFTFPTTVGHSVTEGMFNPTCQHNTTPGAIDSKIHVATRGVPFVFNYTVVDTNTRWLYCDVDGHCKTGMVAAINPPTTGNETFAAYKAMAQGMPLPTSSSSTPTPTTNGGGGSSSTSPQTSTSSKPGGAPRSVQVPIVGIVGVVVLGWVVSV